MADGKAESRERQEAIAVITSYRPLLFKKQVFNTKRKSFKACAFCGWGSCERSLVPIAETLRRQVSVVGRVISQ